MKRLLVVALIMTTALLTSLSARAQQDGGLLVPVGGGYADVYPGMVAAFLEAAAGDFVTITVLPTTYATNADSITAA